MTREAGNDAHLLAGTLNAGWENLEIVSMLLCRVMGHKRTYYACTAARCKESRRVVRLLRAAQTFLEAQEWARQTMGSLNAEEVDGGR